MQQNAKYTTTLDVDTIGASLLGNTLNSVTKKERIGIASTIIFIMPLRSFSPVKLPIIITCVIEKKRKKTIPTPVFDTKTLVKYESKSGMKKGVSVKSIAHIKSGCN
jgi:hypothetical protein